MKYKSIIIVLIFETFSLASCTFTSRVDSDCVPFSESNSCRGLADLTESIELIPLETDEHILGFNHNLYQAIDGTFIIADTNNGNIYRYSSEGHFMNCIGHSGRGPAEYISIDNIQLLDRIVYVYSAPNKRLCFNLDGDFVSSDSFQDLGSQTYTTDSGVLTYYGYGSGRGNRFGLYQDGEALKYLVPSVEKVLNLTVNTPIFMENDGNVFIADSYNDCVMMYRGGRVIPYCKFDFGKCAIPESFFQCNNSMDAMASLMSSPFALINSYQESDTYSYLEVNIQGPEGPKRCYGLKHKDKWHWFSAGNLDKNPLAGQIYLLNNSSLLAMMDPFLISNLQSELKRKVVNGEVLKDLAEDSNYVIAKINLL